MDRPGYLISAAEMQVVYCAGFAAISISCAKTFHFSAGAGNSFRTFAGTF
jgi:hypothetical protein